MGDWIKIGTGAAMTLPMLTSLFLVAWCEARQDGMSFSDFAKLAVAFVTSVVLVLGFPIMAGMGVLMILEVLQ